MYAVIRTGGKQYRVAPGDVIEVEKVSGDAGDIVRFGEVLMLGGGTPEIGAPLISGACVAAEVLEQTRGRKLLVFKKKRRQNYRRKKGHRQLLTAVRVTEILTGGKQPSKKAAAKPAAKTDEAKQAAKPAAKAKTEAKPAAKAQAKPKAPAKGEAKPAAKTPAAKAPAKKAPAKKAETKKPAAKKAAPKAKKD